jgi:hypothetical protein
MKIEDFVKYKSEQIEKLVTAIFKNEVDLEIIPYLSEINHLQNFVTVWSCIGHDNDPHAYLSFASPLDPAKIIFAYKSFAMEVFKDKVPKLSEVSPYNMEIRYSEEGHLNYTFRLGVHIPKYNRASVEFHLSKIVEFLKSID